MLARYIAESDAEPRMRNLLVFTLTAVVAAALQRQQANDRSERGQEDGKDLSCPGFDIGTTQTDGVFCITYYAV
jgi:hypothetical protein